MVNEIAFSHNHYSQLRELILGLRTEETPIVIRKSLEPAFSLTDWVRFLTETCGCVHDRRHYSAHETLEHEDWWEISNQPDRSSSYAYSTTAQPFHTDNAWFADPAEVNFFHMKQQASVGGEQLIYPVSRLMADLARLEPGLFRDLLGTPVVIRKGDTEFFHKTPILVPDDGGRVFWNYYRTEKTDPFVRELCERFFLFLKERETSPSVSTVHCGTGDCLAFHDQRLLHARTAFTATQPRERILYQSMWRLPKLMISGSSDPA